MLNTFQYSWLVKARVVKKYEPKHWEKNGKTGVLLNMDIVD